MAARDDAGLDAFGHPRAHDEIARLGLDSDEIAGRNTYEAAGHWGGTNPWDVPLFVVTHRPEETPPADTGFAFVNGLDEAVVRAREAAGDKNVNVMGGADTIRQALRAGYVEELTISIAPVVLGAGKRLFEGFDQSLTLEPTRVLQSRFATHMTYRILPAG